MYVKRLLVLLVPALAVTIPLATAEARTESPVAKKSAICHRTSSATRPYVKLRVSARQRAGHLRHAADIIPAPSGACPRTVLTPTSGGTEFTIAMTGEAESPAGEPAGTGTATVRARRNQGQVCFSMQVQNMTLPSVGAHIHTGAAGTSGDIVVQLRAPNASGAASGCVAASRSIVNQILANAAGFYVNVHTTEFPGGAVRGQLTGTSEDSLGRTINVQMNGANECNASGTCNLGDPDGAGTAAIRFRRDAGQACWLVRVQNILLPAVGQHIHRGARTSAGGIVIPMPPNPGADGVSRGCATATAALIDEILATPANFYANVHTTDKPGGAVRAQLG
jgi:hypothetical protein